MKTQVMNPVWIAVAIAALLIIVLLFMRNQKDRKEVIDQIKNDYPQKKAGDEDIGAEEKM